MITIDPADISNWAATPQAHHYLPRLIRQLILASVPAPSLLDVPHGSAVWLPGWDGLLDVDQGNQWSPAGLSAWEFGCESRPTAKATRDYRKRTENPEGVEPGESTFVFVTPRQWSGAQKQKWVNERRAEGKWKDVRALNASDLAAWLEHAPSVAHQFARLIGKLPDRGWLTLNEWWENWSTAADPRINASLVLAGRADDVAGVATWAQQPPVHRYVQGATREEALAFLAACANGTEDKWGPAFLAKSLVVNDADAWNELARQPFPCVLIRNFDGGSSARVAVDAGHHVLTPLHANEDVAGSGSRLPLLGHEEAIQSLTEMGLNDIAARSLVRKSARRLAVLRRFLIDEVRGPVPGWMDTDAAKVVAPLILVGQWDESNDHDREVVAEVSGHAYEVVARALMTLIALEDSPLARVGSRWRFVSHEEAWHLLAGRLTVPDVERFETVATKVLETESPAFDMPASERYLASIQGKVLPHSGVLRDGIARGLALLGCSGDRARGINAASYIAERLVRGILTSSGRWQMWATLDVLLPILAEAAPGAILSAVEDGLASSTGTFAALFNQEGDLLFGGSPHTGLLWALERLAWSEDYFSRVAVILAQLAEIDPGGRTANRPSASLVDMFLPWYRQSEASDEHRLSSLNMLSERSPKTAWQLLTGIYPTRHRVVLNRAVPDWRPWAQDGVPKPTVQEYQRFVTELAQMLIQHAGHDAGRWTELVPLISEMSPEARVQAIQSLSERVETLSPQPDCHWLWAALRTQLHRHRSFSDASWALAEDELKPLDVIYRRLAPEDPIAAFTWMFEYHPDLPNGSDPSETDTHFANIFALQESAVADANERGGIDAIIAIAETCQTPELVGRAFAIKMGTEAGLDLALSHVGRRSGQGRKMAQATLKTIFSEPGAPTLDEVVRLAKDVSSEPEPIVDVYLAAPADFDTWQRLDSEDHELQRLYWESFHPWMSQSEGEREKSFVAAQLLKAGRSPAVVDWMAHRRLHHEMVVQALEQLPYDLNSAMPSDVVPSGLVYDIAEMLSQLDESPYVSDEKIALLEIPFLSALRSARPNLALYREIARVPAWFADLVTGACTGDEGQTDGVADDAFRTVLTEILVPITLGQGEVPGKTEDGRIDAEALVAWVNEARRLCTDRGTGKIADQYIGGLLARAPGGADGVWPCEAVREVLENARSSDLGLGFTIGKRNLRGVTTRSAYEGGEQERVLAREYREQAAKISAKWPFTASLLSDVANGYDQDSEINDQQADWRDQFRR